MQVNNILSNFSNRIYVINLKRRPERWKHAYNQLISHGFLSENIIRINAVDGHELFQENINYLKTILSDTALSEIGDKKRRYPEQLTIGAIGCALSHISVWRNIVDNNISSAIVFEDDIKFHWKFQKYFKKRWKNVPFDWDLVFLGCLHKKKPAYVNKYFVKPVHLYLTHAYIINYNGADTLLKNVFPLEIQIDYYINKQFCSLKAYAFRFPFFIPLVWQKRFKTDIQIPLKRINWFKKKIICL